MSEHSVICFGEVLWDILPTEKVVGGAPLNVAFQINQLGLDVAIISKVGDDDLGAEILSFLKNKDLTTELIQVDKNFPTGRVIVSFQDEHSPEYKIIGPVAWDHIDLDSRSKDYIGAAEVLIFGSLSCRSESNKEILLKIINLSKIRVFDVNLRSPFYTQALIEELLYKSDVIKMSEEELMQIAEWQHLSGEEEAILTQIRRIYGAEIILLTKGKDGAKCIDEFGIVAHPGFSITVQDTIGSGDAFLAGYISKFIKGAEKSDCLKYACAMGALVASKKGGTPKISGQELENIIHSEMINNQ